MYWYFICRSIPKSSKQKCLTDMRRCELVIQLEHFKDGSLTDINNPVLALIQSSDCCWWRPLGMRSSRVKGKQREHTGSCGGVQECDTCLVQLSPTVSGKQRRLSTMVLQFTLPPQEGRRSKAMASNCHRSSMVRVDERRRKTGRGRCFYLAWAGEGRWGGGGRRAANSLRWRAGRALRLVTVVLLWRQTLTAAVLLERIRVLLLRELTMVYWKKNRKRDGWGGYYASPRQNRNREGFHMISPARYNLGPLFCWLWWHGSGGLGTQRHHEKVDGVETPAVRWSGRF